MDPITPTRSTAPRFTENTTLAEVLAAAPNARAILMRYHIGGCHHCGFEPQDTIRKVAEDNGVPTQSLLTALNGA
jgi:hypothetical protein